MKLKSDLNTLLESRSEWTKDEGPYYNGFIYKKKIEIENRKWNSVSDNGGLHYVTRHGQSSQSDIL